MLKVAGDKKYLFASIGDKTRYFLAYDVADTKFHQNTDRLLELTKNYQIFGFAGLNKWQTLIQNASLHNYE